MPTHLHGDIYDYDCPDPLRWSRKPEVDWEEQRTTSGQLLAHQQPSCDYLKDYHSICHDQEIEYDQEREYEWPTNAAEVGENADEQKIKKAS